MFNFSASLHNVLFRRYCIISKRCWTIFIGKLDLHSNRDHMVYVTRIIAPCGSPYQREQAKMLPCRSALDHHRWEEENLGLKLFGFLVRSPSEERPEGYKKKEVWRKNERWSLEILMFKVLTVKLSVTRFNKIWYWNVSSTSHTTYLLFIQFLFVILFVFGKMKTKLLQNKKSKKKRICTWYSNWYVRFWDRDRKEWNWRSHRIYTERP